MRSPIEHPDATDEPQLIVGGLWGSVDAPNGQPWVEWTAEHEDSDGNVPTVVLGRE